MALSFPYPETGGSNRPPGNGCKVCVHRTYCPAMYWFMRNIQREPDDYNGTNCLSWSDDPSDKVGAPNSDDIAENTRVAVTEGIAVEANPSGISDAVTGNNREPFV